MMVSFINFIWDPILKFYQAPLDFAMYELNQEIIKMLTSHT